MAVRIWWRASRKACSRWRLTETLTSGMTLIVKMVRTIRVITNSISVKPREEVGSGQWAVGSKECASFMLPAANCLLPTACCLLILLHRQAALDCLQFHRAAIGRKDLRARRIKAEDALARCNSFDLEVEDN